MWVGGSAGTGQGPKRASPPPLWVTSLTEGVEGKALLIVESRNVFLSALLSRTAGLCVGLNHNNTIALNPTDLRTSAYQRPAEAAQESPSGRRSTRA